MKYLIFDTNMGLLGFYQTKWEFLPLSTGIVEARQMNELYRLTININRLEVNFNNMFDIEIPYHRNSQHFKTWIGTLVRILLNFIL